MITSVQRKEILNVSNNLYELKYIVYSQVSMNIDNISVLTGLPFDISQGVTNSRRIGNSINWGDSIDLSIQVVGNSSSGVTPYDSVRFIIFQWFGNQTPLDYNLLGVNSLGLTNVYSTYNHDHRHEYMILFDKCFSTCGTGWTARTPVCENYTTGVLNYNISLAKARKNVQYDGNTFDATNRLYIYFVGENPSTIPISLPTIEFQIKTLFRDG